MEMNRLWASSLRSSLSCNHWAIICDLQLFKVTNSTFFELALAFFKILLYYVSNERTISEIVFLKLTLSNYSSLLRCTMITEEVEKRIDFSQVISEHYSQLTKSEKQIADYLRKNQEEIRFSFSR